MEANSFPLRNRLIFLLAPLGWGLLSFAIFSVLKPVLQLSKMGSVPIWIWLWLLQMVLIIPFWIWVSKQNLEREQRQSLKIFGISLGLGRAKFYLIAAYIAAVFAIPFHDRWYGEWLVFGGIVSPIFEELFSRHLLSPWLREKWRSYFLAAAVSSTAFALMHWGFNNAEAFGLSLEQQGQKFLSHFIFAMFLCLIFRFTKNIQILIWLHIVSNLQFILTKL